MIILLPTVSHVCHIPLAIAFVFHVDVWSFGVVLWELVTLQVPYRNVDSGAVIWGVGSNNLQLPIPDSTPEGLKLLLKQCWSEKPRNRPSFTHILTHLDIVKTQVDVISDRQWTDLTESWRIEIDVYMNGLNRHDTGDRQLVRKRRDELKHAQDVREMYEEKLRRASCMFSELNSCMLHLADKEQQLANREKGLQKTIKSHAFVSPSPDLFRRRRKCQVARPITNCDALNVPSCWSRHAVVRLSVSSSSSSSSYDDDEPISYQNVQKMPDTSSQNCATSCQDCQRTGPMASRYSSGRSSSGWSTETCCVLQRTGSTRTSRSSALSTDSGVHVRHRLNGAVRVESCHALSDCPIVHSLCRHSGGRWSDGRLEQRKSAKCREPIGRPSLSKKYTDGKTWKKAPTFSRTSASLNLRNATNNNDDDDGNGSMEMLSFCTTEVCLGCKGDCLDPLCETSQKRTRQIVNEEEQSTQDGDFNNLSLLEYSPSYHELLKQQQSASKTTEPQPKLIQSVFPDDDSSIKSHESNNSSIDSDGHPCNSCEDVAEIQKSKDQTHTQVHSRNQPSCTATDDEEFYTNERLQLWRMLSSGSTVDSSLERSLELAAIHSDGLSDKERKIKAVSRSIQKRRFRSTVFDSNDSDSNDSQTVQC